MEKENDLEQFLQYLINERQYSSNTVKSYQTDLLEAESFWKTNGGFDGWRKISQRDVEVYLQYLSENKYAKSSQLRKMSSLRSFYRFLIKRKKVKIDPTQAITLKSPGHRLPQVFYEPEIKQVFASLQDNKPLTQRNLALFELFYTSGMRVSEVSNLTIKQIDFNMSIILVHGKGKKDRYVAFDEKTKKSLQRYLDDGRRTLLGRNEDTGYVFLNNRGKKITVRGIQVVMQKVFNAAGISGKVHPHELRHTFATAMLNNGADLRTVQELLGHENLSTTQIYTHVTTAHLQSEYQKFFPRNIEEDNQK